MNNEWRERVARGEKRHQQLRRKLIPDAAPAALIELPDIRQRDHYSCGAAAAMAVGSYFGVGPATLEEWKDALGTNLAQSTAPKRIIEYLRSLGLEVQDKHNMTVDDLRKAHGAGKPVICPIQEYGQDQGGYEYGHYVTVIGVGM